jgi:hypothetical protein
MAPLIPLLAQILIGVAADKIGSVAINQPKLEKAVESRIANDPALKNALNAEPLWASRTATGTVMAAACTLAPYVLHWLGFTGTDDEAVQIASAVGTLGFAGYAFAGRALNWSAPMWSRIGRWFS